MFSYQVHAVPTAHFLPRLSEAPPSSKAKGATMIKIELLNQPAGHYFSGDVVKGVVHLNLSHAITVQNVKMTLVGTSQNRIQAVESFSSNNYFYVVQRQLWPDNISYVCNTCATMADEGSSYSPGTISQVSDTVSEFSKGSHCWSFAFRFSENENRLPSSAEVMQNFIRYSLKFVVVRPYGCEDLTSRFPPVYLRDTASVAVGNAWNRLVKSQHESVDVEVSIGKKGYQSGETVPVLVEVKHFQPGYLPDAVEVTLKQKCTYSSKDDQTCSKEVVIARQTNHIHVTQDKNLHAITPIKLVLPVDLPPTNTSLDSLKCNHAITPITVGTENSKYSTDPHSDWWQTAENEFSADLDDLPPPYTVV
ncbi:hypothetical protein BDF19DRAFT_463884 [Syncephalis fuscata]|nr:hypothetical protein BDF19DRAFT_463884 [Syncephalis fuscata]